MQAHPEYPLDTSTTAEPVARRVVVRVGDSLHAAYDRLLTSTATRTAMSGMVSVQTVESPPAPNLIVTGGPNRAQRRARLK